MAENTKISGDGVDVYIKLSNGKWDRLMVELDAGTFNRFISMRPDMPADLRLSRKLTFLVHEYADQRMARKVADWIHLCEVDGHRELTLNSMDIEAFDELLDAYVTCRSLRIRPSVRGDEMVEAIEAYINQGPLSFDEFAKIIDYLHIDNSRKIMAMQAVMKTEDEHGMPFTVPEMAEIEAWAKETGVWEDMLRLRRGRKKPKRRAAKVNAGDQDARDEAAS